MHGGCGDDLEDGRTTERRRDRCGFIFRSGDDRLGQTHPVCAEKLGDLVRLHPSAVLAKPVHSRVHCGARRPGVDVLVLLDLSDGADPPLCVVDHLAQRPCPLLGERVDGNVAVAAGEVPLGAFRAHVDGQEGLVAMPPRRGLGDGGRRLTRPLGRRGDEDRHDRIDLVRRHHRVDAGLELLGTRRSDHVDGIPHGCRRRQVLTEVSLQLRRELGDGEAL